MGNKQSGVDGASPSASPIEGGRPRAISETPHALKRRLSQKQGKIFNMKIIVRGARGTGKTSLMRRLRNEPFEVNHAPTKEIEVAQVQWGYKATDDVVKLEVWDVVDKAIVDKNDLYNKTPPLGASSSVFDSIRRSVSPSSTWESTKTQVGSHRVGSLDAGMVDVYKGTSAVVFLVNPTKAGTLEYVIQELPNVPQHVMCVVLINFKDLVHNAPMAVKIHPSDMQRLGNAASHLEASVFECCMKDCYGLKTLHNYLNLPFLALKEQILRERLEKAQEERMNAREEINTYIQESNYGSHLAYISTAKNSGGKRGGGGGGGSGGAVSDEIRKQLSGTVSPVNIGTSAASLSSRTQDSFDEFVPSTEGSSNALDSFFDDEGASGAGGDLDKYLDNVQIAEDGDDDGAFFSDEETADVLNTPQPTLKGSAAEILENLEVPEEWETGAGEGVSLDDDSPADGGTIVLDEGAGTGAGDMGFGGLDDSAEFIDHYAEGREEGFVDHYAVEEELLPGVGGNTAEKVNDGEGEDKKPKKSKKEKKEKKVKKEKKSKKSKKDKKKSKKQRFESSSDGETLLNEDDL